MLKLKFFSKKGNKEDQFSSSLIRKLITMGNLKANLYLNYFWEVEGKVISGRAKGRELGFPTANINYNYQICPANGIYADGQRWKEITFGERQQFQLVQDRTIEELIKFLKYIYYLFLVTCTKKRLRVAFIKKVRDEQKFKNEKELKNKMQEDCHSIKNILEKEHIINDNNGNNTRTLKNIMIL